MHSKRLIQFRFNADKFIDALTSILFRTGACTRMKIVKLLYLADRYHLVRHGTPILGDRYHCLPYGPVPSLALDILQGVAEVASRSPEAGRDETCERLLRLIDVREPASKYALYALQPSVQPNLESLSPSENEAICATVSRYGNMDAVALSNLTHKHQAYLKTPSPQEIDYRLFFEDETDVNPDALAYLEQSQEARDLIEDLA